MDCEAPTTPTLCTKHFRLCLGFVFEDFGSCLHEPLSKGELLSISNDPSSLQQLLRFLPAVERDIRCGVWSLVDLLGYL